jgi:hypothetical protein
MCRQPLTSRLIEGPKHCAAAASGPWQANDIENKRGNPLGDGITAADSVFQ